MKMKTLTQALSALSGLLLLVLTQPACRSSRNSVVYTQREVIVVKEQQAPPAVVKVLPIIIVRTPDQVINQYTDGKFYIKTKEGFFYWKGLDDRWYMDENDLKKVKYTD